MLPRNCFVLVLLMLLVVPAMSLAGPINVVGGGSFQALPDLTTQPLGSGPYTGPSPFGGGAFWNNTSGDNGLNTSLSKALNVGYYLTGQGGYSGGPNTPNIAPGSLQYYSNGSGGFVTNESFSSVSPTITSTINLTLAGNASSNLLGYYDSTGAHYLTTPGEFSYSYANPNVTISFTPIGTFGLFLDATGSGNGFYTSDPALAVSDGLSPTDTGFQHFAVFQQTNGTLWVGVEDLPSNMTDGDYNDMVLSLQSYQPVPAPAGLLLFGLGGLGLGGYRWLRRKAQMA